uniref:Fatty acyl-CoA reductase n=1 Tax=Timema californicum TaxID=61474 RepID=A0A7R9P2U5_TIMCA|nr:unnamed protein product [Timema californicum]
MKRLSIKEFYEGRSLFITGATGFLGKLLVEKLIRSCPGVGQIYLLTRSKQGQDVAGRVTSLLKDPAFKRMPEMGHQKVVGIAGDLYQRGLGISPQDRERLCRDVSVVFHVAASVKFDEDLKFILQTNVGSTQAIIDLCKDMSNLEVCYIMVTLVYSPIYIGRALILQVDWHAMLAIVDVACDEADCFLFQSFTYVSTAYSNYPRKEVHEKVYSPPMDPHKIQREVAAMSKEELARKEKSIIKNWPNTYAFSKILAENVVLENSKIIPSCILRPAVVTSSVEEPVPGWIDNQNGIIRTHVLSSQGRMRVAHAHRKYNIELIPVDIVTNATIAAGWDTAYYNRIRGLAERFFSRAQASSNMIVRGIGDYDAPGRPYRRIRDGVVNPFVDVGRGEMKVFNVTTSVRNPIKYGEWIAKTKKCFHLSPPLKAVWYNSMIIVNNKGVFYAMWFTLDLVPAFIMDTLTLRKHKMVDYSTKSLSYNGLVSPFFTRSWKFCDKNVQNLLNSVSKEERKEFNFDVTTVNWDTYSKSFVDGIHTFLSREDPKKLPEARQRYKKLYLLHRLTQAGFTILVSTVAWQVGVTALYS